MLVPLGRGEEKEKEEGSMEDEDRDPVEEEPSDNSSINTER